MSSFDGRLLANLGVLGAVVEAGNFARAADALDMTPSGVSRAVARLEARVGVRLFDRTPRAVVLTDEGRRFHAQIAPLLASLEDAASGAGGDAATVRGRLRVQADSWFAELVMAPALPAFLDAHPEVEVEVMVRDIVADGFDVAVRFGLPDSPDLIARSLAETRVLTCAAPAYLERHGTPRQPGDLVDHACINVRNPATGRAFDWEFHRGGKSITVPVRSRVLVNEAQVAVALCVAGHGVLQPFEFGIAPLLRSGTLVQVLKQWAEERWPVYAYYPSRRLPPAKVRAFVEFIRDRAGKAIRNPGARGSRD
jgi:DNA-binding transcriptional LysR family regulator